MPINSSSTASLPSKSGPFNVLPSGGKHGLKNILVHLGIISEKVTELIENRLIPRQFEKNGKILSIHLRFLNPEYLNTNDALRDLDYLIFHAYKKIIFENNASTSSVQESRRKVARLAIFLRKLSNTSGAIGKRSSGQTAFSHWIEAVYIYLQNDPKPNIDGIVRIGAHDSIEDPNFDEYISPLWTQEYTHYRLENLLGSDNLQKVRDFHTKPTYKNAHLSKNDASISAINGSFSDRKIHREEEFYLKKKHERNRLHLEKIRYTLPDVYFLEKMADVLSNIRNVDAFSLDTNTQDGIKKIERKCMEVVEYYLPRVVNLHDGYFCQLYGEIRGLAKKYRFNLPLSVHYEERYRVALKRIKKGGNFIIELKSRSINQSIGYSTGRNSISVLRRPC